MCVITQVTCSPWEFCPTGLHNLSRSTVFFTERVSIAWYDVLQILVGRGDSSNLVMKHFMRKHRSYAINQFSFLSIKPSKIVMTAKASKPPESITNELSQAQ